MYKTAIEWCESTWNPVSGCLHNCPYCYARKRANQFKGHDIIKPGDYFNFIPKENGIFEVISPMKKWTKENKLVKAAYPFNFAPTFHRYRLDIPQKWSEPRTIFVCSMADLFGEWIPDEWIEEVFKACEAAPRHRYLFLTKNPKRYIDLSVKGILPSSKNMWFGSTTTTDADPAFYSIKHNTFVSIEPIMSSFAAEGKAYGNGNIDWVIIGAESGKHKGKVIPEREWIENIVNACRACDIPVFMKDSLAGIWGEPLIQEFPWSKQT